MSVEIQDNKREKELIKLFNLEQPKNRSRIGVDGLLVVDDITIPFEIKSTTIGDITTARDVNLNHIKKWRRVHWLVGIYNNNAKLQYVVYGSPNKLINWFDFIENDIKRGLKISSMIVDRIDIDMVKEIFGDKSTYTYDEARFVFKRLFTKKEYERRKDKKKGYSKKAMLAMFKEHNWHYLERGSSLNNPKIPKAEYKDWPKITKKHSLSLKKLVREYIEENNYE